MIRILLTELDGTQREVQTSGPITVRPEAIEFDNGAQRISSHVTTWEFDGSRFMQISIETPVDATFQGETGSRDLGRFERLWFPDGTIAGGADGQVAVRDDSGTRWLAWDDSTAWDALIAREA